MTIFGTFLIFNIYLAVYFFDKLFAKVLHCISCTIIVILQLAQAEPSLIFLKDYQWFACFSISSEPVDSDGLHAPLSSCKSTHS